MRSGQFHTATGNGSAPAGMRPGVPPWRNDGRTRRTAPPPRTRRPRSTTRCPAGAGGSQTRFSLRCGGVRVGSWRPVAPVAQRFESIVSGVRTPKEERLEIRGSPRRIGIHRHLPGEGPDVREVGAVGGVAREADDVLAVAQAEFRRNLHLAELAARVDLERMGAAPLLGQMAFQAENDGRRGESARFQFRIRVDVASPALRGLPEILVRVLGGRRCRKRRMEKEGKRRQEENRQVETPCRNDPQRGPTPGEITLPCPSYYMVIPKNLGGASGPPLEVGLTVYKPLASPIGGKTSEL